MEASTLLERRKVAAARRRRPAPANVRVFRAAGEGEHGPESDIHPTELRLEVTFPDGRLAVWFDDQWWMETLRRWKDQALTIHLLPTPDAVLHPVVLHELEMVRRLQTPWTVVGHCHLSDVGHPLLMPRLAVSPYDEIRIVDAQRPAAEGYESQSAGLSLAEVFDGVREIQAGHHVAKPLLTRSPRETPVTVG